MTKFSDVRPVRLKNDPSGYVMCGERVYFNPDPVKRYAVLSDGLMIEVYFHRSPVLPVTSSIITMDDHDEVSKFLGYLDNLFMSITPEYIQLWAAINSINVDELMTVGRMEFINGIHHAISHMIDVMCEATRLNIKEKAELLKQLEEKCIELVLPYQPE